MPFGRMFSVSTRRLCLVVPTLALCTGRPASSFSMKSRPPGWIRGGPFASLVRGLPSRISYGSRDGRRLCVAGTSYDPNSASGRGILSSATIWLWC